MQVRVDVFKSCFQNPPLPTTNTTPTTPTTPAPTTTTIHHFFFDEVVVNVFVEVVVNVVVVLVVAPIVVPSVDPPGMLGVVLVVALDDELDPGTPVLSNWIVVSTRKSDSLVWRSAKKRSNDAT